jgi:hypothetical protein
MRWKALNYETYEEAKKLQTLVKNGWFSTAIPRDLTSRMSVLIDMSIMESPFV